MMKALPLAYDRDMQEDKVSLFDACDTVLSCVEIFTYMISTASWNTEKMAKECEGGYLNATDVADYLVCKGMPFRTAHGVSAKSVRIAIEKNCRLEDLTLEEFKSCSELIEKDIFDLYINNSVSDRKVLGSKIVDESMAEFALGQCAMVQNGNWAWSQINQVNGNKVAAENIKYLPIYMGLPNEENQGLCIGTENYLAINSKASSEDQKASADFLYWLFSSEKGKRYVSEELGFVTPFKTMSDVSLKDPLANELLYWSNKDDIESVPWAFVSFPGIAFKDEAGNALLDYAQGTRPWEETAQRIADAFKKAKSQ
jgi:raffinose/stachyose/melibiose transport system substrate-binding protein